MSRPSFDDEVECGILSLNNASLLINISREKISSLCKCKKIKHHRIPGKNSSNEIKINSFDLLVFCISNNIPIKKKLLESATNYYNHNLIEIDKENSHQIKAISLILWGMNGYNVVNEKLLKSIQDQKQRT
jgi:hypothetical protein